MNKSGWQLKEEEYKKIDLNDQILWEYFNSFFSSKSVNNTAYKFIFMRSLLLNIDSLMDHEVIEYRRIFKTFTEIYWRLYIQENMRQSRIKQKSLVEKEFDEYGSKELKSMPFHHLTIDIQNELIKKVQMICQKNVIGAIYGDFAGTIYSFSNDEFTLCLNPIYLDFMRTHKEVLLKLNCLEWMKYMEKENTTISVHKLYYLAY